MASGVNEILVSLHGRNVGLNADARALVTEHGLGAVTGQTVSPRRVHSGGMPARVSTDGTDATPVTTEMYLCEAEIPFRVRVTGIAVMNGSVAAGNLFAALYDSDGNVINGLTGALGTSSASATTGSVAMSGTDAYQRLPFAGGAINIRGPRMVYVALMLSSTSARFNTHIFGNFGAGKLTGQTNGTFPNGITLPTTFTTGLGPIASLY